MTNKATKYGLMIIAAVLLVALAFAGAGSAIGGNPVNLTEDPTALGSYQVLVVNELTGAVEKLSAASLSGGKNVYMLEDADDWNTVAIDETTYNGSVLILGDNLNFSEPDNDCMMIYNFTGKIYGNGYLIDGFTNTSPTTTTCNIGLIRQAGDKVDINNLHMTNASLVITERLDDAIGNIGFLIGKISSGSSISIVGCSVYNGSINATVNTRLGGIVGGVTGTDIRITLDYSNVFNTTIVGLQCMGGLIGDLREGSNIIIHLSHDTVADCWFNQTTIAASDVGGLIGGLFGDQTVTMDACNCDVIRCTMMGPGYNVGGLVAYSTRANCIFRNCNVINSNLSGSMSLGGLIGQAEYEECNVELSGCKVIDCCINGTGTANNKGYVGGLIGRLRHNATGTITDCDVLHSNIESTDDESTGGLIGSTHQGILANAIFYNCHAGNDENTALNVSSGYPLNGTKQEGTLTFTDCSNATLVDAWPLTFPTKDEIQVFPASKLPYIYVIYKAKDGYVGVPYSESKKTVAMPYGRSEVFDQSKVTPIRGGYAFTTWCLENTATTRPATAVVNNEVVTPGWEYSKTTVNYHNISSETFPVVYTYDNSAVVPTPVRTGYTFNAWNLSSESGYQFSDNTTYFKDGKWNYTGPDGGELDVFANWTADEYNKSIPSNYIVEFGNGLPVVRVIVGNENPSITNVSFEFMGAPANIATKPSGYKSIATIYDAFNLSINGTQDADVTVIFNATGSDTIFLAHNKTGNWEFLKATGTGVVGEYKAVVTKESGFSPFQIISAVANDPVYTSSSSHSTGSTQILSEGQTAPTAYATAAPTVAPTAKPTEKPATPTVIATEKPTTQATQQSPAPFLGILAGLGAAALVLTRMRK